MTEALVFYDVRLIDQDGTVIDVGEMGSNGRVCEFRYAPSFSESAKRFPLDPKNLTLEDYDKAIDRVLFGVFEDSLPDNWGRKLMAARYKLSHAEQSPHLLLQYLNNRSIGALHYENIGIKAAELENESIDSIGELAQAAKAFERGELSDDIMLQRLFNVAGSPGGAHPKASVLGHDGLLKLVKFPSITDKYDVVRLEAACLELARMAGMQVPEFTVLETGTTRMLCLDRFDRVDDGCRHMISMQSLLNVSGYYQSSYVQMADVIREVGRNPTGDLHALYRQMIFNALIGNTDDHLKNFSMYYCDGYDLTPTYDLLPNVNQKLGHTISFLHNDISPTRIEATGSLASRFKISRKIAEEIIDEVVEIVSGNWISVCSQYEVPPSEIDFFNTYINRQRQKLEDKIQV
jgi:serine/threonine-protein kinase HipA